MSCPDMRSFSLSGEVAVEVVEATEAGAVPSTTFREAQVDYRTHEEGLKVMEGRLADDLVVGYRW